MSNIINLNSWLKQADVYELKHSAHAYKVKKCLEDAETKALWDKYNPDAPLAMTFEQYQAEMKLNLKALNNPNEPWINESEGA